jgi:hypothetical protein
MPQVFIRTQQLYVCLSRASSPRVATRDLPLGCYRHLPLNNSSSRQDPEHIYRWETRMQMHIVKSLHKQNLSTQVSDQSDQIW